MQKSQMSDAEQKNIKTTQNKGFNNAREMLLQSIKKDRTAEKMSFAPGVARPDDSNDDVDEILEELLDQLGQIDDEIMEEYTEIYLYLDPENDGYIDPPKLFRALHAVGFEPTESEVMDIIDAVDINKLEFLLMEILLM